MRGVTLTAAENAGEGVVGVEDVAAEGAVAEGVETGNGATFAGAALEEADVAGVGELEGEAAAVLAAVESVLGSAALLGFRVSGKRPVGSTLNNKMLAESGINKRPPRLRRACCKVCVQDNDELIIEKVRRSRPNSGFLRDKYLISNIEYSIGAMSKIVFDKNSNKQFLLIEFGQAACAFKAGNLNAKQTGQQKSDPLKSRLVKYSTALVACQPESGSMGFAKGSDARKGMRQKQ